MFLPKTSYFLRMSNYETSKKRRLETRLDTIININIYIILFVEIEKKKIKQLSFTNIISLVLLFKYSDILFKIYYYIYNFYFMKKKYIWI